MGLASDAGVHALLDHLYACLELCRREGQDKVALHLFTDGRDTGPFTGARFVAEVEERCRRLGVGEVGSICGRYYAMDRDNRWGRVARAYDCLTGAAEVPHFGSAAEAVKAYYDSPTSDSQQGDEFVTPRTVGADPVASRIADGDVVIFYNYRGDRPRELVKAFVYDAEAWAEVPPSPDDGRRGFERRRRPRLRAFLAMTAYEEGLPVSVAFPKPPPLEEIAGAYLAGLGRRQLRAAETEKFPHVTFFFNDYREAPFPGEERSMAQSPRVATYDLRPEMSAAEVASAVVEGLSGDDPPDFVLVNFANCDMVGHTGNLDAAIAAVEVTDREVGRVVEATLAAGGALVVTADHGNAEQMFDPGTGSPHTAHTTYDVECILVAESLTGLASGRSDSPSPALRSGGRLADVLPTVLELMGLEKPAAMTGESLLPS